MGAQGKLVETGDHLVRGDIFIRICVAVVVGAVRVPEAVHRQVKAVLRVAESGQRSCNHRHAVVAALAGDDLLLLRTPQCIVVVPDDLDRSVVRFRTGVRENDPAQG